MTPPLPTITDVLLYSVHAVLLAPVLEEVVFRLLVISPFSSMGGKLYAVIVGSVFFGLMHGGASSITIKVTVFLSGVVYGVLLITTKNIFFPIFVHMMSNITASFVALISTLKPGCIFVESVTSQVRISPAALSVLLLCTTIGITIMIGKIGKATTASRKKKRDE